MTPIDVRTPLPHRETLCMCSRSKLCGRSCLMTRSVLSVLLYRLYMQRVRESQTSISWPLVILNVAWCLAQLSLYYRHIFSLYNASVCIYIQTVLSVLQSVLTNIYYRDSKLLCCLSICITICIITFYYSVCIYVRTVLYYSLYCCAVSEKDEVKWNARSSFAFAER